MQRFRHDLWVLMLVSACASQSEEKQVRSPSYDYPPPDPTTADGDTLGADRQSMGEKLESGSSAGTEGPKAPGWSEEDGKPRYDPKKVKGGKISAEPEKDELQGGK